MPGPEVRVRDHRNEGSSTDLSRNAGAALLLRKRYGEEVIKKIQIGSDYYALCFSDGSIAPARWLW